MELRTNAFFEPDDLPLDILVEMSSDLMRKVVRQMTSERKTALLQEIEDRIAESNAAACAPGRMYADEKGPTRFPHPYTMVKKYSYIYTVVAGWFSKDDIDIREEEKTHAAIEEYAKQWDLSFEDAKKDLERIALQEQIAIAKREMYR